MGKCVGPHSGTKKIIKKIILECTSNTSFPLQQVAKFNLTGDSSLYILLPRASTVSALQGLEMRMTYSALQKMITDMGTITPSAIEVTLPMIKLNYQPNMHLLIKKLGLLVSRHLSLSVRPSFNDDITSLSVLPAF